METMMVNPVKVPFHQLMRFPGNQQAAALWRIRYEMRMLDEAKARAAAAPTTRKGE